MKTDEEGEDGDDIEDDEGDNDLEDAEVDSDEDFDNDEEFQDAFKDFDDMLNDTTAADEDDGGELDGEDDDEGDFREEDVEFSDGWSNFFCFTVDKPDLHSFLFTDEPDIPIPTKSKAKSKKRTFDETDDLDWALEDKPSSSRKKRNQDLFNPDGLDFVAAEDFAAMLEANAGTGLNTGGTTEDLANKDKASVKQLQWEMSRDRWMKDLNRPRKGGNRTGGKKMGGKTKKGKSGPAFRKSRGKTNRQR